VAYQITLTDEEYTSLAAAAAEQGQPVDALVHEIIAERLHVRGPQQPSDPLIREMLRAGHLAALPTHEPERPDMAAERERLACAIRPGQSAADMVIEDRGPRE
jgi:hypothetical protein